jgi:uncharacterized protein (TIGR00369 family)
VADIQLVLDAQGVHDYLSEIWPEALGAWTIDELTASTARLRQATATANLRPGGTVSGPTLMALADSAAYVLVLGLLGRAALAVTSSLHIDFLRRPVPGELIAEATLLKLGRSLITMNVLLFNALPSEPSTEPGTESSSEPGTESSPGVTPAFDRTKPVASVSTSYSLALV